MAKIATAHIVIKPVLDEAELDRICQVIEQRLRAAHQQGMTGDSDDEPDEPSTTWPHPHP